MLSKKNKNKSFNPETYKGFIKEHTNSHIQIKLFPLDKDVLIISDILTEDLVEIAHSMLQEFPDLETHPDFID